MANSVVSIIAPDLIDPAPFINNIPAQELPELPNLSLFLSRAEQIQVPNKDRDERYDFYHCLLDYFSWPDSFSHPPLASLSFLLDELIVQRDAVSDAQSMAQKILAISRSLHNKWLMRVDPCCILPDRDQLVLAKSQIVDIDWAEARQLVAEINAFYDQYDGERCWTLKMLTPQRWYIISEQAIDLNSTPPEKALGRSLKHHLLRDSSYWLPLFNEFQMILHQSSVNQVRQKNNKTAVNSVWFWGQNFHNEMHHLLEQNAVAYHAQVYTDNIIAQAISLISGASYLPAAGQYISSKVYEANTQICYVIEEFSRALHNKDVFTWLNLLEQFEHNYLSAALTDLRNNNIDRIQILSSSGKGLVLSNKQLKRWWRRTQHYKQYFS